MYDFHKLKGKKTVCSFSHTMFRRGMRHLIKDMKRKVVLQNDKESIKGGRTEELLSMYESLNKRLINLENNDENIDSLMKNYNELKETNLKLEQMLLYLSQPNDFYDISPREGIILYNGFNPKEAKTNGLKLSYGSPFQKFEHSNSPQEIRYNARENVIEEAKSKKDNEDPNIAMIRQMLGQNFPDIGSIGFPTYSHNSLDTSIRREPNYLKFIEFSPSQYCGLHINITDKIQSKTNINPENEFKEYLISDKTAIYHEKYNKNENNQPKL